MYKRPLDSNRQNASRQYDGDIKPSSTSIFVRENKLLGSCFVIFAASGCAIPAALACEIQLKSLKFRFGTGFPFLGNPVMLSHCLFSEVMRWRASPNCAIRPARASLSSRRPVYNISVGGRRGGGRRENGGEKSALFQDLIACFEDDLVVAEEMGP